MATPTLVDVSRGAIDVNLQSTTPGAIVRRQLSGSLKTSYEAQWDTGGPGSNIKNSNPWPFLGGTTLTNGQVTMFILEGTTDYQKQQMVAWRDQCIDPDRDESRDFTFQITVNSTFTSTGAWHGQSKYTCFARYFGSSDWNGRVDRIYMGLNNDISIGGNALTATASTTINELISKVATGDVSGITYSLSGISIWFEDQEDDTLGPPDETNHNFKSNFFNDVCLNDVDVEVSTRVLALDADDCIVETTVTSGSSDYVNNISGVLQSDNMVDITLGYLTQADVTFPDAIDLSGLVDSTTVTTDASGATPVTVTDVTFDADNFTVASDGLIALTGVQNNIDIGHFQTATPQAFVSILGNNETISALEFDDRHFTLTTDGSGNIRILGESGDGIGLESGQGNSIVDSADTIVFDSSQFTISPNGASAAASTAGTITLSQVYAQVFRAAISTSTGTNTATSFFGDANGDIVVTHNIGGAGSGFLDVVVQVYDNNRMMILPEEVVIIDRNNIRLEFAGETVTGTVIVTG